MKNTIENKSVYIMSVEGASLYSHMVRGNYIKRDFVGMIPYSLELLQLKKQGLSVINSKKHPNKQISCDVINVKFNQKVKSATQLLKDLNEKIATLEDGDYKNSLIEYVNHIETGLKANKDNWNEVSVGDLRSELYSNGFVIVNPDGTFERYVVYKRSSAKSRTGQCLFIKESLHEEMINWSRMNLPFEKDMEIDYPSLLAYESLVGSSLEDTIVINPNNILMVEDVESTFTELANVVKTGADGLLDSTLEEVKISNSIWDGESLLDAQYYQDGTSMKLLRNHFFKSAAFNTNIQQFLKDNCPVDVNYDEWTITDMFNEPILASEVHMITTPSSLKALKFSSIVGTDKDMWSYWKELIVSEDCIFGVCKHEKPSKLGEHQQTSYQILNSLPASIDDVKNLTIFECEYIEKLKNDDDFFIGYIEKGANEQNANQMFADIYKVNRKIANTESFREFRKRIIKDHVKHVKKGKVRLSGDYCVMLGNPLELLKHAIRQFDVNTSELSLTGNQIYTNMFAFDKEVSGFRNPHTSGSNVLVAVNTYHADIEKYFNLTKNIAVMNSVKFPLLDILSGSDYDSDTILLLDDSSLLELTKKCFGQYKVCINKMKPEKIPYKLNNHDMCVIDNALSQSQKYIGKVVNTAQLCLSKYWNELAKGETDLDYLMKNVDITTVLSGVAIDMAKKKVAINMDDEIKNVEKSSKFGKMKPNFWVNVSQSKTIKNRVEKYDCPMDYLNEVMSNLPKAKYRNNVELSSLLIDGVDARKGNRKQKAKIAELVDEMQGKIIEVNSKWILIGDEENEEKHNMLDDITCEYVAKIAKLKVKPETMFDVLSKIERDNQNIAVRLMNALYTTQPEVFLGTFTNGK